MTWGHLLPHLCVSFFYTYLGVDWLGLGLDAISTLLFCILACLSLG